MQTDQKIKDLELQKAKLFGRALKLFPNSKEQLKVRSDIDKINDEISKLKKIGFMTAKQKAAREKFKKVVAEAGKLRKKNPKLTQAQAVKQAWAIQKKVGAIKIIEKGENKSAKPKATYQQVRTKKGTYKGLKKVGALPKKKASASKRITDIHKDSKSHNVNIKVVSGLHTIGEIEASDFTRISNDTNGNPRYVIHFLQLLNDQERLLPFNEKYDYALKKAKKMGGRKFSNKQYGGGVVFQSYNIYDLAQKLEKLKNS
jgi:hypothetical protein